MTDNFDDFPNNWDDEGDYNPYKDTMGWSDEFELEDPFEKATEDLMDNLGIEDFDEIIFDMGDVDPDTLRGNRFENLQDAIAYLFDSGVLRFSGVVFGADELEIFIDPDTQGNPA